MKLDVIESEFDRDRLAEILFQHGFESVIHTIIHRLYEDDNAYSHADAARALKHVCDQVESAETIEGPDDES